MSASIRVNDSGSGSAAASLDDHGKASASVSVDQHGQEKATLVMGDPEKEKPANVVDKAVNAVERAINPVMPKFGRVNVMRNRHYHHDGLKSYGHALLKFNFAPTKDGPFYVGDSYRKPGVFGVGRFRVQIPGSVPKQDEPQHVLMKKAGYGTRIHERHHFIDEQGHPFGHHHPSTDIELADGEVQATDVQHDSLYLCPVNIGSPPKTLLLDFDTGSSDLWVWSSQLDTRTLQHYGGMHSVYDPDKSVTARDKPGYTWMIQYGDGSTASGSVVNDNINIGNLVIEGQAIETARHLSHSFAVGAQDGLLGLAFSKLNTAKPHPVNTPVDNMIKQEDIPSECQLFTAYLGSWRDVFDVHHPNSFYTFGYIDQDALSMAGIQNEKDIHYTKVDTLNGFWQIDSAAVNINGRKWTYPKLSSAIMDTGTTLALVSDEVCEMIYRNIPGAEYDRNYQGYTFPGRLAVNDLPVVEFDIGGKFFKVNREDLAFSNAGPGRVYGGIQSRGDMPFDVLGDTFLKSIYAIFDQGNKRFGAVQRNE